MSSAPQSAEESAAGICVALMDSLVSSSDIAFISESLSPTWSDWLDTVSSLVDHYQSYRKARAGLLMRQSARSYALILAFQARLRPVPSG